MYELLVKGGLVIDPANGLHAQRDIGIVQGKIAAVASDIPTHEGQKVVDARDQIVTPGLIDLHAHVAEWVFPMALNPDDDGVSVGVTTVCDAGSTGHATFPAFRRLVIPHARTDVFCFLHVAAAGLTVTPEVWSWQNLNVDATLETISANRDVIKGVKVRAIAPLVTNLGVEAISVAKKVAAEARLPLMVHLGLLPADQVAEETVVAFTREMLALLDEGDILSHAYTWKAGGVIRRDGSVLPELEAAVRRGVLLDVAQADSHWCAEIARYGIERGLLPTAISTDITKRTRNCVVFDLTTTMSRFLALGLTLDQVVAMTTINPARVLAEEQRRGSLGLGMPADVTILRRLAGDFVFADGFEGATLQGNVLLAPVLTLKAGVEIAAQSRFEPVAAGWQCPAWKVPTLQ